MSRFSVDPLKENSLMYLYAIKDEIDFEPDYQRQGDIWPLSKRYLLIDSLLNGFDIPKIYFHEINKTIKGRFVRYAVIDGKQRLESIFKFLEGEFPVSDQFSDLTGTFGEFSGKYYKEFGSISLKLKARFESLPLPIYVVKTTDLELIEEMFSRLNEASPLNAPEKRNALGGPAPKVIKCIAEHKFFESNIPFDNRRYRHYDIAAKLLLLSERSKVVDTKKIHLDKFVKSFVGESPALLDHPRDLCLEVLESMSKVFIKSDPLLRLVTMIPIYYCVSLIMSLRGNFSSLTRSSLLEFDEVRRLNRDLAQEDEENLEVNYDYLEFDRLTQTPNDSSAIEFKINILLNFLGEPETQGKALA
ncbi:DUF262 domain-containing protein [Pseudomonas sp. PDM19]|uniref:DUF262 domain-containing protein n=1 Tax=Pseudomonas sp. PDM19 TaxID=2769272 RepID=UPI00177C12EC|nr:DUF262 domain-containing protein [Pseudomonas sp. PDM19]MBD9630161.1 DUF262 domain-containing protein [Pseudomonas sp. PDM19]